VKEVHDDNSFDWAEKCDERPFHGRCASEWFETEKTFEYLDARGFHESTKEDSLDSKQVNCARHNKDGG
jgi:hypothetical protein